MISTLILNGGTTGAMFVIWLWPRLLGAEFLSNETADTLFKQHVAPFRDNLQTSMFSGTLVATDSPRS